MNPLLQQRYGLTNNRPLVALAPMAGVTDLPFREVCEQLGADFSVTEMAATAPQLLDSVKNQSRLHFTPHARVKILQIIGNDAAQMATAAAHYANSPNGADIIDINLGCPAKKISSKGAGSALLSDLKLVESILSAVTKACSVPVTLKTRLGPDHNHYTLRQVAQIAEDVGIELMTVHGRTRACRFNGEAQFDEIAAVKQACSLAIIANGDIDSVDKAQAILAKTQCDGLMIGRSAVGNPWLFSELREQLDTEFKPKQMDKKQLILDHIENTQLFYGDKKGVRFARKHIQKYLAHLGLSAHFSTLAQIDEAAAQRYHLAEILSHANLTLQRS